MAGFARQEAEQVLYNKITGDELVKKYPQLKEDVLLELAKVNEKKSADQFSQLIERYKSKAKFANQKIRESGENQKTIDGFLPDVIKARIAIHLIEQIYLSVQTKKTSGTVRFNLWDGTLLQKLLFEKGFTRKLVSLGTFRLVWPFIINKKILMPLVNNKGIYCFYSDRLVLELAKLIGQGKCLEIGAGDGTLTRFLKDAGIQCIATDDYSWEHYIQYPEFVLRQDAKAALENHRPEVVICSWPPPGNTFERTVFKTDSVRQYIVLGSRNPMISGNHQDYEAPEGFTREESTLLSRCILPFSDDNVVYIFRRV